MFHIGFRVYRVLRKTGACFANPAPAKLLSETPGLHQAIIANLRRRVPEFFGFGGGGFRIFGLGIWGLGFGVEMGGGFRVFG